jgi:hypothetical protein
VVGRNDYVAEVVEVAVDGGFGCFVEVVEGWHWVGACCATACLLMMDSCS